MEGASQERKALRQLPIRQAESPRKYPKLSAEQIVLQIENKCGCVHIAKRYGEGRNKVFILPEAYQEFITIVNYGRKSPMNFFEQKLMGYGHFFAGESGCFNIVISHFIQVFTMNRTTVSASNLNENGQANPGLDFLEYYREEFLRYESKFNTNTQGKTVDPFLEQFGPSEFVLEGHTHPNLGVFWSGTDRESGMARAAKLPICIFVCDPVRSEMLACVGRSFDYSEVIPYEYGSDVSEQRYPEVIDDANPETVESVNDIVRIANGCLRKRGFAGSVKCHTRIDGKVSMKIKLVAPKRGHGR